MLTYTAGVTSSRHRYTVTDPDGLTATGELSVVVVPNRAPVVAPVAVETAGRRRRSRSTWPTPAGVTDPDGDALAFACCNSTVGGTTDLVATGNDGPRRELHARRRLLRSGVVHLQRRRRPARPRRLGGRRGRRHRAGQHRADGGAGSVRHRRRHDDAGRPRQPRHRPGPERAADVPARRARATTSSRSCSTARRSSPRPPPTRAARRRRSTSPSPTGRASRPAARSR